MDFMHKATNFFEIPNAVDFTEPIASDSEFYVDFSRLRGNFTDKRLFRYLSVNPNTFAYTEQNFVNKKVLFLAGHRGSGKTTELKRITKLLQNPNCFFTVFCDLKEEALDLNNLDFVDILLFILENLISELNAKGIAVKESVLKSFYDWYSERIEEINNRKESQIRIETGIEGKYTIPLILNVFAKLRTSLSGTHETKEIIRTTFKNKFSEFALKFNEFTEEIARNLRGKKKAKDILFVIDGFEKIGSLENRRKIILEDSNRLIAVKTNMLITLPIELMKEESRLSNFSEVILFPNVKIKEKDNSKVEEAFKKFEELIDKRIDSKLFESKDLAQKIIEFSGGSPREVLRIIHRSYIESEKEIITQKSVENAIKALSSVANYLTESELLKLKELKEANEKNEEVSYDSVLQELLEKRIVFEYNTGSYRRVSPIIEVSKIYQQYVS